MSNSLQPTAAPGVRRSPWVIGLLALWAALQITTLWAFADALDVPHPGLAMLPELDGAVHAVPVNRHAEVAMRGLGAQPRVISANGTPLRSDTRLLWTLDRVLRRGGGELNTFTLESAAGDTVELTLPTARPELAVILRSLPESALFQALGLLYMALGVGVWWRRPGDRASEPLLLFCMVAGFHMMISFDLNETLRDLLVLRSAVPPMYGPAVLHLALKFTGFHNRRGLRALWGLTLVIGIGLSATVLLGASRGLLLIGHPVVRVLLGVQILGSLLVCVALSFAAARPPHPLGLRRRARVLAVACMVSFGLPGLSLVLPAAGDSVPVILALLACFPAMMGYAIVRLGMFDIRVVIGQGLLYITLSLVVLLGYLGLVWLAIQILGGAAERPAIVGAAAVMAVLVLSLVQLRVQDWINRRVFRSRYVLGDALAEASRVLAHSHSEQEVVRTLRTALLDTMQLSRAVLALQIPGSRELRCITLGSRPDPITGELPAPFPDRIDPRGVRPLSRALGSTEAVSAHDSQAASAQLAADPDDGAHGTGRDEASFWPHYGLEWIVPLRPGDPTQRDQQRARGLLLLGPKLDGRLLDRSDRALVATLGNQLAVALDNARAFEEIRRLKDGLEEQVEERTRDLTEALDQLKRTQGQLVESEKQALLGRVVAGIVHEINSPLGSLRSAVDTSGRLLSRLEVYVQRHEQAGDAEAARLLSAIRAGKPLLSVMQQSGERIDGLVESLKRFVSLDEHEMRPLDVREGIDSALTLLSPMLGDRIQVTRSYPSDPPVVQCYPARLNQVFLNLIENAVEAVDDEGEIEIRVGRENGHVEVEVRDNGRGIEADRLASLFDFGFVNKDGRVRMRLGLPSNKRTVEELGGSLQVESRAGRGTSVRVELPAPSGG